MKNALLSTGFLALAVFLPMKAQAETYCADRICHSYDRNGVCNNYTCPGSYYGWYGDPYYNRTTRRVYYNDYRDGSYYRYGDSSYYADDYYYRYDVRSRYDSSSYRSRYDNRYDNRYYDDPYYRYGTSSYYPPRYYPSYYDDYRSTDRIYAPKAGYYYRY